MLDYPSPAIASSGSPVASQSDRDDHMYTRYRRGDQQPASRTAAAAAAATAATGGAAAVLNTTDIVPNIRILYL